MLDLGLPVLLFASTMGEALASIHLAAHVDGYDIEFVLGSERDECLGYSDDIAVSLQLSPEQVLRMSSHEDLDARMRKNVKQRTTRMWVLDFNLSHIWPEKTGWEEPEALISHLVQAFFGNDSYYPRPCHDGETDWKLWEAFTTTCREKTGQILREKDQRLADLPGRFINACISYHNFS